MQIDLIWQTRRAGLKILSGAILLSSAWISGAVEAAASAALQQDRNEPLSLPNQSAVSSTANDDSADKPEDASDSANSRQDEAKTAFDDKQFLRAWRLAPAAYPMLGGVDSPSLSVDTAYQSRTGDAESSPASGIGTLMRMSFSQGSDIIRLDASILELMSSKFGSQSVTTRQLSPADRLKGVQPSLFWERQNTWWPSVELGLTPIGGKLSPTFQGRAAFVVPITDDLQMPLEISRTSVADSILSYTGGKDPTTGRRFGRVTETAVNVKLDYALAKHWSVTFSEMAGVRGGDNVRDNFHEDAEASLSYGFKLPGFAAVSIGPEYEFEHFDHDAQALSFGGGGYYSPQTLNRISLYLNFATSEGQRWLISGDLAPGVQREHQFGSSATYGGAVSSDVAAGFRLTDHVSIGAIVHADGSRQYGDYYAGFGLKFSLDSRMSLLSIDLPKSPFRD